MQARSSYLLYGLLALAVAVWFYSQMGGEKRRILKRLERLEELVRGKISRLPGRSAEQLKLLLRADRKADTSRINQVINRLQTIGVGAARIATDPRGS